MFQGLAGNSEGPVGAGLDSFLAQDGRIVGFASGVNFNEDFELEGIRTLGFYGDRFFKSLGYTANASMESYVIRKKLDPTALYTTGWQSDGSYNLNTAGSFDFTLSDLASLEVLYTLLAAKNSTIDTQFGARALNTKTVSWKVSRIIPGLEVS